MLKKLGCLLMLCAVLGSLNMHLAVMQGIAWASMLNEAAESSNSLSEAIEQTFGSGYQCEMCVTVMDHYDDSSTQEGDTAPGLKTVKLLPLEGIHIWVGANQRQSLIQETIESRASLTTRPDYPPPRV